PSLPPATSTLFPYTTLCRSLGYRPELNVDVFKSERDSSTRNKAIGYYLLEVGFLESDLDVTLETYFKQCSIDVTIDDLARMGMIDRKSTRLNSSHVSSSYAV